MPAVRLEPRQSTAVQRLSVATLARSRVGPAVPIVVLAVLGYRQRWVAEDAFITLRVVENVLAGHGPVFNQGERVEAYTHPLWLALLSAIGALGLPTTWGAVILGLLLSLIGLIAGMAAASCLFDRVFEMQERSDVALPLGASVFVALPVVWDFATSGLETGLLFAWLGVSYWLTVRIALESHSHRFLLISAVVLGLGPLVRPDLAIFSMSFLLCVITCRWEGSWKRLGQRALAIIVAAAVVPVAYQVFRMGYFAAIVPNTALAKEASDARWSQGLRYLWDLIAPYYLWLPLVVAAAIITSLARTAAARADRMALLAIAAPVAAAALHLIYVVRVGGDFMHGRFLLPTLFGLLLPVMLVRMTAPRTGRAVSPVVIGVAVIGVWAIATALWFRVPYQHGVGENGIADERGVYVRQSGNAHPVTIDDYMQMILGWPQEGRTWAALEADGVDVLLVEDRQYPRAANTGVAVLAWNIGLSGFAAGIDVHVTDRYGLADPLASRLLLDERGRPGHEKQLPPGWAIARFTTAPGPDDLAAVFAAARTVLTCGEVSDLLAATSEPMSLGRFFDNILSAWSLHQLRIPADPETAAAELCR